MPRSEERHGPRWMIVRGIINRHDPAGLLAIGCPEDEYDPEVPGVLAAVERAGDATSLASMIERVFRCMLGRGSCDSFAWRPLGEEIWHISRTDSWRDSRTDLPSPEADS